MKEKCDEKRKARYLKLVCIGILGIYAGASYYNSEPLIAQEETETRDESRQLSLEEKERPSQSRSRNPYFFNAERNNNKFV